MDVVGIGTMRLSGVEADPHACRAVIRKMGAILVHNIKIPTIQKVRFLAMLVWGGGWEVGVGWGEGSWAQQRMHPLEHPPHL